MIYDEHHDFPMFKTNKMFLLRVLNHEKIGVICVCDYFFSHQERKHAFWISYILVF